mmetsp:Transcript_19065/g.44821  ORF Transcript_19065/g.44821 Transcript_19065/m.44821 type:complete len:242 (-) Transcript_19065:252-977(-)
MPGRRLDDSNGPVLDSPKLSFLATRDFGGYRCCCCCDCCCRSSVSLSSSRQCRQSFATPSMILSRHDQACHNQNRRQGQEPSHPHWSSNNDTVGGGSFEFSLLIADGGGGRFACRFGTLHVFDSLQSFRHFSREWAVDQALLFLAVKKEPRLLLTTVPGRRRILILAFLGALFLDRGVFFGRHLHKALVPKQGVQFRLIVELRQLHLFDFRTGRVENGENGAPPGHVLDGNALVGFGLPVL